MKRIIAGAALATLMAAAPIGAVFADPIDDATPACVVYVSDQTVPVSAQCEAYSYRGVQLPALSINEGK